jgi:Ser/Thr protein kinase RdoA (MazF antagonist)
VSAAQPPGPRRVTLVLCSPDGDLLGELPAYDVPTPWWQEVREVVAAARDLYRADVTVLRLLQGNASPIAAGGPVTYLAQVEIAPHTPLVPWTADLGAAEPLRQSWARPGGPAADVAWAVAALQQAGTPVAGAPVQVRTWNLSSLWRLQTADGAAWLKVVPPFFAHEGSVLSRIDSRLVPPLIATDGPRVLLTEVPGEDFYVPPPELLLPMVRMLVGLQVAWRDRVDELLHLGAPDWRRDSFAAMAAAAVSTSAADLDRDTVAVLEGVLSRLDHSWNELAGCGVPDTLVHGDFHPGNVHGTPERLVLLDWGDCGVGNPLLDQSAFLERVAPADRPSVLAEWSRLWRAAVPGSDPDRAATLLAPITALRQAVIYTRFLAAIEPSERVYHAADPATWLRRAALAARTDNSPAVSSHALD